MRRGDRVVGRDDQLGCLVLWDDHLGDTLVLNGESIGDVVVQGLQFEFLRTSDSTTISLSGVNPDIRNRSPHIARKLDHQKIQCGDGVERGGKEGRML